MDLPVILSVRVYAFPHFLRVERDASLVARKCHQRDRVCGRATALCRNAGYSVVEHGGPGYPRTGCRAFYIGTSMYLTCIAGLRDRHVLIDGAEWLRCSTRIAVATGRGDVIDRARTQGKGGGDTRRGNGFGIGQGRKTAAPAATA